MNQGPGRIPKPALIYMIGLEMLQYLDDLNAEDHIKKAVRSIESFVTQSFYNIEKHPKLAEVINNEMVTQFNDLINSFEATGKQKLHLLSIELISLVKQLDGGTSIYKAAYSVFNFTDDKNMDLTMKQEFTEMINEIEIYARQ